MEDQEGPQKQTVCSSQENHISSNRTAKAMNKVNKLTSEVSAVYGELGSFQLLGKTNLRLH